MTQVRAKFSGGSLHPLDPLSLAEGQEVLVSIEESPPQDSAMEQTASESAGLPGPTPEQTRKALREMAGAWKGNSDSVEPTAEERIKRTMSAAGSLKGKIDGEAMKRMIYEARRTGSRETPEP